MSDSNFPPDDYRYVPRLEPEDQDDERPDSQAPDDDLAATRRATPYESQTILPDGGMSGRASPPPLYPGPDLTLPEHVDELDLSATRVTPAAVQVTTRHRPPNGGRPPIDWGRSMGCFLRGLVVLLFLAAALAILAAILGVVAYASIASTLPSVDDLRQRSSQFETTRILDRNGDLLYEILDPNAGRRTYVPLSQISPNMIAATIATEDKDFYSHPGFDPIAIIRALWQNYTEGDTVSGASTITQQLARALLLTPEERAQRTYLRKAREIILAAEITRRYSKDEILELYLNENYYGNLAYGIEAAAETYFHTSADKLTLAQASFLAGLPQAPSVYDIYTNRNATLERQKQVLVLMFQDSNEKKCIAVSNSSTPICVTVQDALDASKQMEDFNFPTPDVNIRYPHWVQFIREQLESQYDPQTIYRSGFTVYTTLDPNLQDLAQQIVTQQVGALADKHVTDGALVAIRPTTGEILAMVGSADYYNAAISGQVNMATSPTRQPGSSIKPVNYVAAFEKGWTPATLIWDVPSEFPPSGNPNDPRPPYVPTDYDNKFHGPVTVRTALSNSFNIPAVKTLQFVGIYDDPNTPQKDGMIGTAERLGITTFTRDDYGLSLTLGGGEVSLLQLTGAYSVFANAGVRIPPVGILKITDNAGNVVYQYQVPKGDQAISPQHAYLMTSILSDNQARSWMFGSNSALNLPFPVAAKTGTTNDFRDNWTMGYTPDLTVGVWVGNADYTPMVGTTGLSGAAPIWSQFMQAAEMQITNNHPTPFTRPPGIVDKVICAISGAEPSKWCPQERTEIFAENQPPLPADDDLWKKAVIDTWTGLLASSDCNEFVDDQMTINVTDQSARSWIRKDADGTAWAKSMGFDRPFFFIPDGQCQSSSPHASLSFQSPSDGDTVTTTSLDINAVASATNGFKDWHLDWAKGDNPNDGDWQVLKQSDQQVKDPATIYNWDLSQLGDGTYSLRLYMDNSNGGYAKKSITVKVQLPTPTPTLTPTALPPTPTDTALPPTNTPLPTSTNTPVPTPTGTPIPVDTAVPTNTLVPTATTSP